MYFPSFWLLSLSPPFILANEALGYLKDGPGGSFPDVGHLTFIVLAICIVLLLLSPFFLLVTMGWLLITATKAFWRVVAPMNKDDGHENVVPPVKTTKISSMSGRMAGHQIQTRGSEDKKC